MAGDTGRTVVLTERVPAPSISASGRRALAALVLAHLLLVGAVLADGPELVLAVALLLCAGAEVGARDQATFGWWALSRVGLGPIARMGLRSVAVLVAMSTAGLGADRIARVLTLTGLVAVPLSLVAVAGLVDLVRRARQVPVTSRGLVLAVDIPPAPPSWAARVPGWPLDVVVSVVVLFVSLYVPPVEIIVLTLAVVLALAPSVLAIRALVQALRHARRLGPARMTTAVEDALAQSRPDLALYFAGPAEALYQLTMWLPAFERLAAIAPGRRTVVVLRDPEAMLAMPPTSLPVVCVERGNALLQVQWPTSLRLACYVGNAAGNIHFLRERRFRHVFIGHGDSDKTVSSGRYAKVYDEVWVAGPAGRERWRSADVGVGDTAIVEVGAPFVESVRSEAAASVGGVTAGAAGDPGDAGSAGRAADGKPTIVYAPTWEGVADGADTTSVGPCGEALVRRLLDLDVRVIYRPHPLTGTRDPLTARAHARILRMLALAEPVRAVRSATDVSSPADALDLARVRDIPSAESTGELALERAATLLSGPAHVYAPATTLPLEPVLRAADGAVTDISAALSTLFAAGIPVAVTDPAGLPPGLLAKRYPMTADAYVIGPDGDGTDRLVAAVHGDDVLAAARDRVRDLVLGPPDPSSARFAGAVESALQRARAGADPDARPPAG